MTAMRRVRTDTPTWPELMVGMTGMLWRCRLELALTGGIGLTFLLLVGLLGELLAGVLVVGLVAAVLAVPVVRCWLLHALRAARVRRGGGGGGGGRAPPPGPGGGGVGGARAGRGGGGGGRRGGARRR